MRIRVLIAGNNSSLASEAEMLKERGFLVYTCNHNNAEALADEIQPDVVYLQEHIGVELFKKNAYANLPIIQSLIEDDIYLVNRKNTEQRSRRKMICDNLVDAIRVALKIDIYNTIRKHLHIGKAHHRPYYAGMA